MKVNIKNTALVVTDPQNDFLSPAGVTWGMVGKNVTENNTVENIESLIKTAKGNAIPVFISPHYFTLQIMAGNSKVLWKRPCTIFICLIVRAL